MGHAREHDCASVVQEKEETDRLALRGGVMGWMKTLRAGRPVPQGKCQESGSPRPSQGGPRCWRRPARPLAAHTSLEPACQAPPPLRPCFARAATRLPWLPVKRKQPPGLTWKCWQFTASRHSAGVTAKAGPLGSHGKGAGVIGLAAGSVPFLCPNLTARPAPLLLHPRAPVRASLWQQPA